MKAEARVVYHARKWYVHIASAFPLGRYYGIYSPEPQTWRDKLQIAPLDLVEKATWYSGCL